ncbi:MAG: hypothetical protein ACOY82_04655 [Pseudomonadota bacterium]
MRRDMNKVIVERPRTGAGYARSRPDPVDPEESPKCEGLRKRHASRKWLNENLRPLERYLAAQVGRPWDKVYSEICAGIDRRNTVQRHIHRHLEDFVATRVSVIDGVLHWSRDPGGPSPLGALWGPRFYVDPRSGLLRVDEARNAARRLARDRRRRAAALRNGGHREDSRIIDAQWQLHRVDGIWYRVEVARVADIDPHAPMPVDALRRLPVHQCPTREPRKGIPDNFRLFGDPGLYAVRKRQLSARELRHFRLDNHNA